MREVVNKPLANIGAYLTDQCNLQNTPYLLLLQGAANKKLNSIFSQQTCNTVNECIRLTVLTANNETVRRENLLRDILIFSWSDKKQQSFGLGI